MKLTHRQQKIADSIPNVEILADIGCDHGYVGAYALVNNIAKKVLFCDISLASLEKAKSLMQKLGNEIKKNSHEYFVQDGIANIKCDCAVIAGMGGLEITKILQQAKHLPKFLILQPMRNQFDLRAFLCNNYFIESDSMFCDKKYYDLIVAKRGSDKLTHQQLLFGKTNLTNPSIDFANYVKKEIDKCTKILQNCASTEVKERLANLLSVQKNTTEQIF